MGCSIQGSAIPLQPWSRLFEGWAVVVSSSAHAAEFDGDEELSPMLQERSCSLPSVSELTIMLKYQFLSAPELHPASTMIIVPIMSPLVIVGDRI